MPENLFDPRRLEVEAILMMFTYYPEEKCFGMPKICTPRSSVPELIKDRWIFFSHFRQRLEEHVTAIHILCLFHIFEMLVRSASSTPQLLASTSKLAPAALASAALASAALAGSSACLALFGIL